MQYLSKAYSYYSGINPATLSGAIDVIVVKHVDENGDITLSSSPFHVRFGKLQVLRAGDKRVTVRLPNNLPHPHIAPFDMKVSDTGEAFFVLETDEDVPEELLTSPVVSAADDLALPPSPPPSDEEFNVSQHPLQAPPDLSQSFTQQPFGATEVQATHKPNGQGDAEVLPDVEPLDLNDYETESLFPGSHQAHVDGLDRRGPSRPRGSVDNADEAMNTTAARTLEQPSTSALPPRNPIEARGGEKAELPVRDHRLANYGKDRGSADSGLPDDDLPKVKPGEGEGPDVLYGKNVVLDMAGYHNAGKHTSERTQAISKNTDMSPDQPEGRRTSAILGSDLDGQIADNLPKEAINSLIRDLLSALPTHDINEALHDQHVIADPTRRTSLQGESTVSPPSLTSASPDRLSNRRPLLADPRHRYERGQSEPPPTPESFVPQQRPRKESQSSAGSQPLSSDGQVSPESNSDSSSSSEHGGHGRTPTKTLKQSSALLGIKEFDRSSSTPQLTEDWLDRRARGGSMPPVNADSTSTESASPDQASSKLHVLTSVADNPYLFLLKTDNGPGSSFELAICESDNFAPDGQASDEERALFMNGRISVHQFLDDSQLVDDPRLVILYSFVYMTWSTAYPLLLALSMHRRVMSTQSSLLNDGGLPSLSEIGVGVTPPTRPASGYGWSRWWRRAPVEVEGVPFPKVPPRALESPLSPPVPSATEKEPAKHYAKTLRLSSGQLKQLDLKPGPNTVTFSVTSSYSGQAICTARIFLWDETDQIVISDIDGTITKSDALGHVFAAIGRDWTHIGIAKLYTDICNNGYKMLYLTSRAIGQADSTREYLKSINQEKYRLPEGPVIMSPDRLIASLHREVIMRKPELFKMACLRDILRLFGTKSREAFYAGFGNRITDAMSYRSVGIPAAKIYTIDSSGVVKTELLHTSGHKGSYVVLNDLVNEVFPPVKTKFQPEYTDFNYWRTSIPDVTLPQLAPPSPALSARSDSSRLSVGMLGKIASIGRRSSKQAVLPTANDAKDRNNASSRPSSPLIGPATTPDDLSEAEEDEYISRHSRSSSMPGSFADGGGQSFPDDFVAHSTFEQRRMEEGRRGRGQEEGEGDDGDDDDEDNPAIDDSFEDGAIFDDDILATGEMRNVPF